jgi:hypothetical protein
MSSSIAANRTDGTPVRAGGMAQEGGAVLRVFRHGAEIQAAGAGLGRGFYREKGRWHCGC